MFRSVAIVRHIWVLPVFRYPINMVIYHYPLVGVIFIVMFHIFITKNYPNFSQINTLNTYFGSFTPFMHLG